MAPDDLADDKLVGADRVLALLVELAGHPEGATLDDLAATMGGSKSTIHRALGSLVRSGLAEQSGRGRYVLGDEFIRLAFRHHADRPETSRIEPVLRELSDLMAETTHYGVLDGRDIVYRAKTDPAVGAVRLTSVVGGRNPAATTAVGRVLLSGLLTTRDDVTAWLGGTEIIARTPTTITSIDEFTEELRLTRRRGYGIDDEQNELGVTCIAVPISLDGGTTLSGAISVSGLTFRCPLPRLLASYPEIVAVIERSLGPGSVLRAGVD